ncbi:hypothetical protein K3495_g14741 [Podosphaera aphanis]|nr:hypothetical protein K3495_g14741 [Podosphaera aphanis]
MTRGTLAPVPRPKGKRKLTQAQVDELEAFVRLSRKNRQMSYLKLVYEFRFWNAGVYAITSALKDTGYYGHMSSEKPPLSEANKRKRFEWFSERLHWTYNDWCRILWSDETWVTDGRHRDAYVTRKPGDELEDTCLVDKTRKRTAWMFWGSFFGRQKGPCLFWEKSWGSITAQKYYERIVPLVVPCIEVNPVLQFMQDNAPPHKAAFTRDRLRAENIEPIIWAAYSPDLNPIEAVWSKMKDFIEDRYPDLENGRDIQSDGFTSFPHAPVPFHSPLYIVIRAYPLCVPP